MSRRGEIYFWGTFASMQGQQRCGILLYKSNRNQGQSENSREQLFSLDLLQENASGKIWKRINSVPLRYPSIIWAPKLVDAQVLWLNSRQTVPLLKLTVFVKGDHGPIGEELAVVFPTGLSKKARVQSWPRGYWHSSGDLGRRSDWSTRDEKGNLSVISISLLAVPDPDPDSVVHLKEIWTWNGTGFVLSKTIKQTYDEVKDENCRDPLF